MKYITDKKELSKALKEMPVLKIDIEHSKPGYSSIHVGDTVKVLCPSKSHPDLYVSGKLQMYNDRFYVSNPGSMISSSFGYTDLMEIVETAQAPAVKANDKVVIVCYMPDSKMGYAFYAEVKYVNSQSVEACRFEPLEN